MKKLFLLFAFLPFFSFAQVYSEVVEIPEKKAGQLYSMAREWFAKSFISADNALLMDDMVSGKIIAKGSVHISEDKVAHDWYANFTIKVEFKDGRYKSEISDISITRDVSEDSTGITTAFKKYLDKKEYYNTMSDPEWYINKRKIGKTAATAAALPNQFMYNSICKTETEMKDLLSKLQQAMKKSEDDW